MRDDRPHTMYAADSIAVRRRARSISWRGRWVLLCIVTACSGGGADPLRTPSTVRMAERLDSIALATDANPDPYANSARLAIIRDRRAAPDLRSQLLHRAEVAEQLLRAGRSREATEEFEGIRAIIAQNAAAVPADFVLAIDDMLAIAYLRVGQQENCPPELGALPCSFPFGWGVRPREEYGYRNAIAAYDRLLAAEPDGLVQRWLLNVAYMSLGEYPDGVPATWLIPEAAFGSEYDIGLFPDVAPQLGLAVVGLAGGSIAADFDGDGFLDIMASSMGLRDQLRYFHSDGRGGFVDRTLEAGLEGLVGGLNMVHADYDNDGFPDVLVLRGGWLPDGHHNSLLHNEGDGTFTDVTEAAGMLAPFPTQAAVWGDFDNDGWLDLFVGNESRDGRRHPAQLFRNNADGTFTDIAARAGVAVIGFTKGVTAGDIDNDGRLDLYVSRLAEPNLLFHNDGPDGDGGIRFSEIGAAAGVREPSYSFPTWFFDYDNDGWEDLFVSGFLATSGDAAAEYLGLAHNAEMSRLYRNNRDGTFTDATAATGLGDKVLLTMGSNFGDLDNDGFLDFYATTGDPHFRSYMPNRMFRNTSGETFQEVTRSGGFGQMQKGHGVSFADFDHDGDQDIHHVVGGAYEGDTFHNALYVNPGHGNRWITVLLEGVETNRDAIGARVRVTVATPTGDRDIHVTVTTGGSFGANSLRQEIGLGNAMAIRTLTVTWPASGRTDVYEAVAMDQMVSIREGAASPVPARLGRYDLGDAIR